VHIFFAFENLGLISEEKGRFAIEDPVATATPEAQFGAANSSAMANLRSSCGDPVNCVTGNFSETQADVSVGGRGVGLDLTRTYNAQAAAKAGSPGMFGYGWTGSFSDHLVLESASHRATVFQANGSTVRFSESEGGTFIAPAWSQDTLTGSAEAGYTLTFADQTKFAFNGSGRLESEIDRNGNKTTLTYNGEGRLTKITDPDSRAITLSYNVGGQVESAKDPMGHVVKYAYESGNLTSVTLPGKVSPNWRFKYDGSHRITLMINGLGGETANTYDGSSRVVAQKDPFGHTLKFEYETFQTKIKNEATGAVTFEQYGSDDLVRTVTHGYGTASATTETITYNEAGEPTSITDGNNHKTVYEYNGTGDRTKMTDPEGHETTWTYDGTHDVETMTRPNGEKTTIERDEHGNPTHISRPAPGETTQKTSFEYNAHGQATSMIDPLNHKWSYEYDGAGDRTGETDPEGDKTTWGYDEDSQITSIVTPRGNVEGGEPAKYTTTIERDEQGRRTKLTDPLGHKTLYAYDADGNLEKRTNPNGHETKITYNLNNEPTKVTEPNGATIETGYDGAGQVENQTDGNEHTTTYTRNVLEQVTRITDPLEHVTEKTYDPAGNVATLKDAAGRTTTYTYNKDNQLTKMAYSDGVTHAVEYEYDENGNRILMADGTGETKYTYDQLDRLTKTVDGHGDAVGYEYNLANQQTEITYPNGKTVEQSYDKVGRLESIKDWLEHMTSFSYDPDSNLTATTFPSATKETDHYTYNEVGQQTEIKMSKEEETLASLLYTRDKAGQVTQTVTKGLPGEETVEDTYDENERLTKAGGTTYEYDAADNPIKIGATTNTFNSGDQLTKAGATTNSYDEVGERTKTTPSTGPATTYSYDQAGDMTSVSRPEEGEVPKIEDTYAYNGDGQRTSRTTGGKTTYITLDTNTPLPTTLTDGTNNYIYGPAGAPIEQIDNEGHVLYLHHDQQASTRLLTDTTGTVEATMTYDPYGNQVESTGTATTPLGYDGQYTNTDTGLIYLRARSYDPGTAQFMSVDPIVSLTRVPYLYANDNALNEVDPVGLCSVNPFSSSGCLGQGVEAGVQFAEEHPVATGIALGVIAVGTGGAALAVEGVAATVLAGSSVAAGTGASALDASKCLNGDAGACVGAGLGITGVGLSGPEFLAVNGLIEGASLYRGLAGFGLGLGAYGTLADLLAGDPAFLSPLLGC
jgi:RHS repeat-associated protein